MEAATRAFYTRGDLDLILASPAPVRRLFMVRMVATGVSTTLLTGALASPFINVLAYLHGPAWLASYGLLLALGAAATALALLVTIALFRVLGPARTRLVAQIVTAGVGAVFVIGVQLAAILSTGSISRLTFIRSEEVVALGPPSDSGWWFLARAAMGDVSVLIALMAAAFGALALVAGIFSKSFGRDVVAASGVGERARSRTALRRGFRRASVGQALRRKEWALLRRDPWLISETLMQTLYLLPPALLLWLKFGDDVGALIILVPVLVMASGQLAGGLAWLAVSGEDAPDLVVSAPISNGQMIRAKIEAILTVIAVLVSPLLAVFALAAPLLAAISALGIAVATIAAATIQIWFRAQVKRSLFRRRHASSRIATMAEAFSSILWAGTAALVAGGSWLAVGTAVFALLVLLAAWLVRPRRAFGAVGA
jgi:ABC-2 type transport system permease protein